MLRFPTGRNDLLDGRGLIRRLCQIWNRTDSAKSGECRVFSPLSAAWATFAPNAGVWLRRRRLVMVSPVRGRYWPPSGTKSTYPVVRIFRAASLDTVLRMRLAGLQRLEHFTEKLTRGLRSWSFAVSMMVIASASVSSPSSDLANRKFFF